MEYIVEVKSVDDVFLIVANFDKYDLANSFIKDILNQLESGFYINLKIIKNSNCILTERINI